MKPWECAGTLLLLVTVMAVMSGCTSSASTGTEPAATSVPQVVYVTVLVTPSMPTATTVPARTAPQAMPDSGIMHQSVTRPPTTIPTILWTVPEIPDDDAVFEYNNLRPISSADGSAGTLIIRVEGCPADGLTVFIARKGVNVTPLNTTRLLDHMVVDDNNPVFLQVNILPDGSSETTRLAPGDYTAYLPNKNGDEIEDSQPFRIGANYVSYVSLSGSSYTTPSQGCSGCSCRRY